MHIQGSSDLLSPAWLEIPDEIYEGLRSDLRRELALEPLAPGQYLELENNFIKVDECIVGCKVTWGPAEGFFLIGETEIPLRTRSQAAARGLVSGFSLGDFLAARHRLQTRFGGSFVMLTDGGSAVTIQCERNLIVRFFSGKAITVQMVAGDTINHVKAKIQELEGIPPAQQQLYFASTALEGGRTLADYNIPDGATVNLVLRLHGGPASGSEDSAVPADRLDQKWGKGSRDALTEPGTALGIMGCLGH